LQRKSWFRLSALVVLAVLMLPTAARTEDLVPIRLRYVGSFPPPEIISSNPLVVFTTDQLSGVGTHVGQFTGIYPHTINFDEGTFSGTATITAANGDLLYIDLSGTGVPISPTVFSINLQGTITGGTGRFEGAAGELSGTGTVDLAALEVSATLEGDINKPDLPYEEP
jgi:hypothetical protein